MTEPEETPVPSRGSAAARRLQLVRLVGSCLALLAGVVFCHQFSAYQSQGFLYGAGLPLSHLPVLCRWYATVSFWLVLLPPIILLVGSRRLLAATSESAPVELLSQLTFLLTVVLVLGCILAWQVPYVVPMGEFF